MKVLQVCYNLEEEATYPYILLLARRVHTELSKSRYINMEFKMKPLCFNKKKRVYYFL